MSGGDPDTAAVTTTLLEPSRTVVETTPLQLDLVKPLTQEEQLQKIIQKRDQLLRKLYACSNVGGPGHPHSCCGAYLFQYKQYKDKIDQLKRNGKETNGETSAEGQSEEVYQSQGMQRNNSDGIPHQSGEGKPDTRPKTEGQCNVGMQPDVTQENQRNLLPAESVSDISRMEMGTLEQSLGDMDGGSGSSPSGPPELPTMSTIPRRSVPKMGILSTCRDRYSSPGGPPPSPTTGPSDSVFARPQNRRVNPSTRVILRYWNWMRIYVATMFLISFVLLASYLMARAIAGRVPARYPTQRGDSVPAQVELQNNATNATQTPYLSVKPNRLRRASNRGQTAYEQWDVGELQKVLPPVVDPTLLRKDDLRWRRRFTKREVCTAAWTAYWMAKDTLSVRMPDIVAIPLGCPPLNDEDPMLPTGLKPVGGECSQKLHSLARIMRNKIETNQQYWRELLRHKSCIVMRGQEYEDRCYRSWYLWKILHRPREARFEDYIHPPKGCPLTAQTSIALPPACSARWEGKYRAYSPKEVAKDFVGCFGGRDGKTTPLPHQAPPKLALHMTPVRCVEYCSITPDGQRYRYAGLHHGFLCH